MVLSNPLESVIEPSMLISDDDRSWRETLRSVFEPLGFRTLLAADGAEAWDILRSQSLHVVLLDMHMPRLTGLDVLRQLQEAQLVLPCVLISGGLNDQLAEEARRANAYSVLQKPVSFQQLTGVVRTIMQTNYDWPL